MRAGWNAATTAIVAIVVVSAAAPARAEPAERRGGARLEASGFLGVGSFGDSELGNSWAPEQVPGASTMFGMRVGWLAVPRLARRGGLDLSLGVEAELAIAAAFTGDAAMGDGGRKSYFAPVFGWRAHAMLRQASLGPVRKLGLHVLLGAGGATVASSSPFMAKETDPVGYAGLGATYALSKRWQVRLDARQGVMPGRASGTTGVRELQLGLTTTFGPAPRRGPAGATVVVAPAKPGTKPAPPGAGAGGDAKADTDTDGDGLPDRIDRCPRDPETVNGVDDGDGCPEPDPDGDGVLGAADACPQVPEDADGFEDADGCPDPDNDGDGIADALDTCRDEPETKNGYTDTDGCPDVIPDAVSRVLANGGVVRFAPGRARVATAARRALRPVFALLQSEPALAILVEGIPDRAGREDLAKRRAEAVKWHLVDLGLAEDRIETAVGAPGGKAPIALSLRRP